MAVSKSLYQILNKSLIQFLFFFEPKNPETLYDDSDFLESDNDTEIEDDSRVHELNVIIDNHAM